MEHDVNIILMILVLGLVLSMIGMVIYYRMTYESLNDQYRDKIDVLDNTTQVLNSTMLRVRARDEELARIERKLRDFANELNISQSRETVLGDHFSSLKGEKEEVEDFLNKTQVERARYENLYNKYYTDFRVCKKDYDNKVSELTVANNRMGKQITKAVQIGIKSDTAEVSMANLLDEDPSNNDLYTIHRKALEIDDLADKITNDSNLKNDIQEIAKDIRDIRGVIRDELGYLINNMAQIGNLAAEIQNG
ncbi:hypothetical protein ACFLRF_02420 [Candidatus Altiarchaeota archaeon]